MKTDSATHRDMHPALTPIPPVGHASRARALLEPAPIVVAQRAISVADHRSDARAPEAPNLVAAGIQGVIVDSREPSAVAFPQLAHGATGSAVELAQVLLEERGHAAGAIDGRFGDRMALAVQSLQNRHGIVANSIIGAQTWAVLQGAAGSGADNSASTAVAGLSSSSAAMVRSGSRGAEVRQVQQMLADAGYNPGPVDGIFGSKTRAAVIAFQRAHGLAVDGIVGPNTMAALRNANSATPPPADPTPPPADPTPPSTSTTGPSASARRTVLRSGSRGSAVREAQQLLADAGFDPGPADGIFGSRTRGAVIAFQRAHGLVADGIIGSRTWVAFGGTPVAPTAPPVASGNVADFLRFALAQTGDTYIFGAETRLDDPDPDAFDCSELVQWACAQAGVTIADGSWNQKANTTWISVAEAMRTPGALLFTDGHVAISLGDGRTIEARGSRWGVGSWDAVGRFTSGGLIPGMSY